MGRRRKRGESFSRTQEGELPDIDEIYKPGGRLKKELEDPETYIRRGFVTVYWERPKAGYSLGNTDATVPSISEDEDGNFFYGYGYAVRNSDAGLETLGYGNKVVDGGNTNSGRLIAVAEMTAIQELLENIDHVKCPNLIISSDNKEVITALNIDRVNRQDLLPIFNRITALQEQKYPSPDSLLFQQVDREQNFLGDWCSHLGARSAQPVHCEKGDPHFQQEENEKTTRYFVERDASRKGYLKDQGRKDRVARNKKAKKNQEGNQVDE